MFSRLDEERLCLWPPTKLLANSLLNSWNEVIAFGGSLPNYTLARPFSVIGKALYMILSRTPWRCMVVLNVTMWSQGSRVPSYEFKVGILNLEGRGWHVMDAMKGELVLWTRSSTWFTLFMEYFISSMASSSSPFLFPNVGTLRVTIPLDWSPPSTLFNAPPFFEFWPCSSAHHCRCFLLTSLVSCWFHCVKSTIVVAMDYSCCWMTSVLVMVHNLDDMTGGISTLLVF